MDKRAFLKILSTLMAVPVFSPLLSWAVGDKLKNWAGNLEYGTDRLYSAHSLAQVQEYVKKQRKLKVLGPATALMTLRTARRTCSPCGRWTRWLRSTRRRAR